jgi:hypothetical protein
MVDFIPLSLFCSKDIDFTFADSFLVIGFGSPLAVGNGFRRMRERVSQAVSFFCQNSHFSCHSSSSTLAVCTPASCRPPAVTVQLSHCSCRCLAVTLQKFPSRWRPPAVTLQLSLSRCRPRAVAFLYLPFSFSFRTLAATLKLSHCSSFPQAVAF